MGRHHARWTRRASLVSLVAALLFLSVPAPRLEAADRTDVPLKNWGGFARFRDQVYDDLERLVASGLAGRTVLNMKPMSRTEVARIIARVIQLVRRDDVAGLSNHRDLAPVLERLADEFRVELAALGVRYRQTEPPDFVEFVPLDHAQVGAAFSSRDRSLVGSQGRRFQKGVNAGGTFDSRLQIGDWLSFYVQPELLANEEYGAARLFQGYAKLTLWNVELGIGRESLWWGPGLHGSLILSNNAPPLDHVRIGSAEPFMLPWIGEWVGPMKAMFFVAQLEERRDIPDANLSGMRLSVAPFTFYEFGLSRTVMFGGDLTPALDAKDYVRSVFDPTLGQTARTRVPSNNLWAVDGDLRLRNLDRFLLPVRDARVYVEIGWDDACCKSIPLPCPHGCGLSGLLGVHLIGVFGIEGLESRAEYARSSRLSYKHSRYHSGYWTRGEVISHFMGTKGEDAWGRSTYRLSHDLQFGIEASRSILGSTVQNFRGPKEERLGAGVDVSWRFLDRFALFAQYEGAKVDNRNFQRGDDGYDHVLRLEITRSFR